MSVNRYELAQEQKIAELQSQVALRVPRSVRSNASDALRGRSCESRPYAENEP